MRRTSLLFLLLGSLTYLPSAGAQEAPARREPLGYVRIWNFANSIKVPLSVAVSSGTGEPVILSRSTPAGYLLGYRGVAPGRYKLVTRLATAGPKAAATPDVVPTVDIVVSDRSFQTVILQDQGTGPRAVVLNDTSAGAGIPKDGKRLRILNFAAGQNASLLSSPDNQVIMAHVDLGASQHMFPNNPGVMTIVMSNKLPNGHEAQQNAQLDFSRVDSITAVLMFDRYGRLTFQAVEDAKAD